MQVIPSVQVVDMGRTNADKCREYRQSRGDSYRRKDATRKRRARASALPEFIGVDGEGVGKGKNHRYVLLGVGDQQHEQVEINGRINWEEAFSYLYKQFEAHPRAAFVGFYLGYDWSQLLSTLPQRAGWMLLSKEGKALRKPKINKGYRFQTYPVREGRWEINSLGLKTLQIRPRPDGCYCWEEGRKSCSHESLDFMTICDAGPFFQMGFAEVIKAENWASDPDGPVCTPEQEKRIVEGKAKRDSATHVDAKMRVYNVEENLILAEVMRRIAKALANPLIGVKLSKDQWYGPGPVAARWLRNHGAPRREALTRKTGKKKPLMPKYFWQAAKFSFFGGWFEIFSHGLIKGDSYNYDIHNAYPFAATKLPHICVECQYPQGKGNYRGSGDYVLLHATVYTRGYRIGAMPNRGKDGSIRRPNVTTGWYWKFEIDAARRAGLVKKVIVKEWTEFVPCKHPKPFRSVADLYYQRLKVGKYSALGMVLKLVANSLYGKFAQMVGEAPYNNWLYASYITAHCRSQILDAIATHPGGADSVLMVATDGICFDSPHPGLEINTRTLGSWEEAIYHDLVLFKPGVYWHKEGKEALLKVKSRGVPRREFAKITDDIERQFERFALWMRDPNEAYGLHIEEFGIEGLFERVQTWPNYDVTVEFRVKSCNQALNEGDWSKAGEIQHSVNVVQRSEPWLKRRDPEWDEEKQRIDTYCLNLDPSEYQTYYHGEVRIPKINLGVGHEGTALGPVLEAHAILRGKPANYDIPLDEKDYEWENVWGGEL